MDKIINIKFFEDSEYPENWWIIFDFNNEKEGSGPYSYLEAIDIINKTLIEKQFNN